MREGIKKQERIQLLLSSELEENSEEFIEAYKFITLKQFTEFIRLQEKKHYFAKKYDCQISDTTILAIFQILDLDESGTIDNNEIIGIFEGKQHLSKGRGASEDIYNKMKDGTKALLGAVKK